MKRKLSTLEYLFWLGSQKTPNIFSLSARIKGVISKSQLNQALSQLKQRHPLLAVRIVLDHNDFAYFVSEEVDNFPIRVVERKEEQDWIEEVKHELQIPFDWSAAPLLRFVLLNSSEVTDLIIICEHCLADGLSLAYLLRDILQQIADTEQKLEVFKLLPSMDELIPRKTIKSVPLLVRLQAKFISSLVAIFLSLDQISSKFNKSSKHSSGNFDNLNNSPQQSSLKIISWELSPSDTTALITRCKQEKTSVHAAICTAFLLAFAQIDRLPESWQQKVGSPVNLRNILNTSIGEYFGFFVGRVVISLDYNQRQGFWALARECKQQLNQEMQPEKLMSLLLMTQAFLPAIAKENVIQKVSSILNKIQPKQTEEEKPVSFSISNLGNLNFPQKYGDLELTAIYAPMINIEVVNQENLIGITTINQQMFFTWVFSTDLIKQSSLGKIKEQAMFNLIQAINQ